MLLQRKLLAFVAPSGEKYLIFMLLKVRKWTVISPAKIIKFSKVSFTTTKKETALAPFNLAHPVHTSLFAKTAATTNNYYGITLDGE